MASLEVLADHPAVVFGAYIAALLPLTVIYALDFISEKWRTIRETRRKGYFYLVTSIVPLTFLIFYIHLQKVAKDYKEMAAATSAAIFCIVHIMRTIWGLIQLHAFKLWNMRAMYCLNRLGYGSSTVFDFRHVSSKTGSPSNPHESRSLLRRFWHILNTARNGIRSVWRHLHGTQSTEVETTESHSPGTSESDGSKLSPIVKKVARIFQGIQGWVISICHKLNRTPYRGSFGKPESEGQLDQTIDNVMIVNSSLLDNEFRGADIPCRLNVRSMQIALLGSVTGRSSFRLSDHLQSVLPVECSVQWLVAFLSKFGSSWLASNSVNKDLAYKLPLQFLEPGLSSILCVTEYDPQLGLRSLLRPDSALKGRYSRLSDDIYRPLNNPSLPFNARGLETDDIDFSKFGSSIRNGVVEWDNKSLHVLGAKERDAVQNVSAFDLSRFSTLMDIVLENGDRPSFPTETAKNIGVPRTRVNGHNAVNTFRSQIDCTSTMSREFFNRLIPLSTDRYLKAAWRGRYQNKLLLQASVHVDNWKSLESVGLVKTVAEGFVTDGQKVCNETDTVKYHKNMERIRHESIPATDRKVQERTVFLGCVIESVRTFLAHSIRKKSLDAFSGTSAAVSDWEPKIGNTRVPFLCSFQLQRSLHVFRRDASGVSVESSSELRSSDVRCVKLRLLWELQSCLHECVTVEMEDGRCSDNLPASEALIMLFILGFPSLDIHAKADADVIQTKISLTELSDETEITIEDCVEEEINATNMGFLLHPVEGPQDISVQAIS